MHTGLKDPEKSEIYLKKSQSCWLAYYVPKAKLRQLATKFFEKIL